MQTDREASPHLNFEQVVTILRIVGWVSFVVQMGLAAVASTAVADFDRPSSAEIRALLGREVIYQNVDAATDRGG